MNMVPTQSLGLSNLGSSIPFISPDAYELTWMSQGRYISGRAIETLSNSLIPDPISVHPDLSSNIISRLISVPLVSITVFSPSSIVCAIIFLFSTFSTMLYNDLLFVFLDTA
jgi:hypothetical protein